MNKDVKIYVLNVFTNKDGKFGNPVGIVLDEKQEFNPKDRQKMATNLGFSESVFINNLSTGDVSIFNPKKEVKFAGHALVGTAHFIRNVLRKPIDSLNCKGGHVLTWQEGNFTWIQAKLKNTPSWNFEQVSDTSIVDNQSPTKKHTVVWAWLDKNRGLIQARTFASDWGIPEDEANGSGAMQLAARFGQKLEIRHGKGSVIYAKPAGTGLIDVGGRVKMVKSG